MKDKRVLVVGLGISGVASIKALSALGAKKIYAYDIKNREELNNIIEELKDIDVTYYPNSIDFDVNEIDLAIKSPGIKYETPVIQKLLNGNVRIISDLEAGFSITNNEFISITGTNGKTTTTTLIGKILEHAGKKCKTTGNIGSGVFYDALTAEKDEYLVTEASSFQLDGTDKFKPHISVITNLTPDHLDWHKTLDNYYRAKMKSAINQDSNDYCILNYEDPITKEYVHLLNTNIIYFSSERKLDQGIYLEDGKIIYNYNGEKSAIMNVDDIFIVGKHNIENVMAAAAAAKALNISNEDIKEAIKAFRGVEHRLEFVEEYNGVKFYNDSKGTNPDASIKAIQGVKKPIILIAGGYDKKSKYDEFIESFDGKVKAMILLGQTKDDIKKCALEHGFNAIYEVENMDEAVKLSYDLSASGDTVLLSPACASWGMYPNYEVRGRDFKERVRFYGEKSKKQ